MVNYRARSVIPGHSVPCKVFELGPILPNLTKLEGFLCQNC